MAGSAEFVDLVETEGASRKPTKTMEFSPQVTKFFNIMGFLEIFASFYGILEVKPEILRTFLEIFVARPITTPLLCRQFITVKILSM